MNKKQFYTACIVALVLSFGTYFGLNTVFPYHPEEIKVGETAELAEVLAGSLNPAEPDGTPTDIGTTEEMKAPPTEPEPAADETVGEAAAAETSMAEPETPVEPATAAPETAAEPAPEPVAAPPEPKPEVKAEKAEPKAVKPAPKAADKAAAPKTAAKLEPIKPWWSGDLDGELSVVYVGSLAEKAAIVVMFNGAFSSTDSLNQYGKVSINGGKVSGRWDLSAKNKRMAIFAVPKAGRYQLSLGSGLADGSGKAMKKAQQGQVDVK